MKHSSSLLRLCAVAGATLLGLGCGSSTTEINSGTCERLAFATRATNLGDAPVPPGQVAVWERRTGRVRLVPLPGGG